MRRETYRGRDMKAVSLMMQAGLGPDAMIVSTRVIRENGSSWVEVVAMPGGELDAFRRQIEPAPLTLGKGRTRPLVIGLVGPAGAGKTTSLAKLAVDPRVFGRKKVGVLNLDTSRLGAAEQLEVVSSLAGFPMLTAYDMGDVPEALVRLADRDVILIDTPGRLRRGVDQDPEWFTMLALAAPDEVHLVMPASIRPDIAQNLRQRFDIAAPTHLLLSRLDEVPGEEGVAELASAMGLPARWVMDGEEVSGDLHPAPARLLSALGRGNIPMPMVA